MEGLSKKKIESLFKLLNQELKQSDIQGEIYLMGGAVMCLVFEARQSTQDVDAYFQPSNKVRNAAVRVGIKANVGEKWLNDGVKGYLSNAGSYAPFLELSNLKVLTAQAEYMLAMKCLAMRIGEEFHDLDDIQYLLRYLNVDSYNEAIEIISNYYPLDKFPQKTLYALQELLNA